MEVIFLLPVASLPDQEDLNLAEGNPMLVEYRLPEEGVGEVFGMVAEVEPEVAADILEEEEELEQDNQEVSVEM